MRKVALISCALALSMAAQAGEKFGGIDFHSSLPATQVRTLKQDFSYLYQNPIKETDPQFKSMASLAKVDGPNMYNWIYNRVKYVLGQSYDPRGKNTIKQKGHVFPSTPLPPSVANGNAQYWGVMIMYNMAAELYVTGKKDKTLMGLRLDDGIVYAPSPRAGIVQVGEGLFLERLLVNKEPLSEANTIKRLGTIFHEARHGDGHSEHTGFIHTPCPTGHVLSGLEACEPYSNGSYSLEAVATKTMLMNCKTCSNEDKGKLTAAVADAFSRVIVRSHVKTETELLAEIATYQQVIDFYVGYLAKNPVPAYVQELERMRAKKKESEDQLKELRTPVVAKEMDPKPEGSFKEVSVEESSKLMNASLRK